MICDEDQLTSNITDCLVMLLQQRDAMGRTKYGKTLDRDDLTPEQWAQHMAEELLDGAGYAMAYAREVAKMRTERDSLRDVRETLRRECEALKAERAELIDDVAAMQQTNNDLAAENGRLREALDWYAVKVNDCRKLGKDGDMARGSLDKDGGSVARAALNATTGEGHE